MVSSTTLLNLLAASGTAANYTTHFVFMPSCVLPITYLTVAKSVDIMAVKNVFFIRICLFEGFSFSV
jgi:hypothetical protein